MLLLTGGCSLEGFASGGAGGGGPSGAGGSGASGPGGAGGGCAPCGCEGWSEQQLSDAGPAVDPSLAWADGAWAVAWQDARDGNNEIYFARLGGADLRVTNEAADSFAPVLVWAGTHHAIAYEDWRSSNSGAYLAWVDAAGQSVTLDREVHTLPGAPVKPTVAWGGAANGYAMVWSDFRDGSFELRTGLVDDTGAVDPGFTDTGALTTSTGTEVAPAMLFGNVEHALVWQDDRDGNDEIYFARLDGNGVKIGAEVRVTDAAGNGTTPAIAWTTSGYGIVWADNRDGGDAVYFTALTEGGVEEAEDVRISEADGTAPTVAWDGTSYAVAWQHAGGISFVRLSADGEPLSPPLPIAPPSATKPSLVWSGTAYGVAWQDDRDGTSIIYFASCTPQ
jgi:hypothetical protein